ncbi:hypothetical protein PO883_31415 [Massilia sp. DJPM01]|uniref:antiviral RADAR system adenosine triphosphatase RdrA n=1 Tax=Massilia sp. DJPM01 TaxID=3024404 RepID=UPI00259F52A3|nr:antiviral RADAR system adenosine triphosphatase RdrA [Massilia sp. DJPM01]MDM5181690.1 hypothetical protein [Massilia sp. DJPM01]
MKITFQHLHTVNQPVVFFPINQREQAAQTSSEVLLALAVYEKLADIVREATNLAQRAHQQDSQSDDVNQNRAHTGVLIDGSRGTGKSSVLVNIAKYLKQHDPGLEQRVHFLKPLDPTLLEVTDDLFLNVIVAGLVSDDAIQAARHGGDDKANLFHEQLQRLGNTLERLESQRDLRGLDKLRAFMGNQNLAQEVHLVFKAGLDLLGKQLLVLPIDDVDTSLDRAFDNLEVIRKYLVSPYVLPVISGDLALYNDLSWRHFHGKLLKDSNADSADAVDRAKDLAQEYQRKILPLQYRIEMPEVLYYLRSPIIGFYDADRKPVPEITMAHFYSWLEAVLNERTNGSENSYLQPPVKNVRSLAQLVYSLQSQIPELAQVIADEGLDPVQLRRQVVIPMKVSAIRTFKSSYAAATRIVNKSANEAARRQAYTEFSGTVQGSPAFERLRGLLFFSQDLLKNYCQFSAEGGPAYLALTAQRHWWNMAVEDHVDDSVLGTFLFQPMTHRHHSLRHFGLHADTTTWLDITSERAPHEWLESIPAETIIPYPSPEPGYVLAKVKLDFGSPQASFAAELLLHRNFYTTSKRATLACSGRVFELIVASFVSDVSTGDIANLLQRSPFHSLAAVAATKTQLIASDDDEDADDSPVSETEADDVAALHAAQIEQLSASIEAWRTRHDLYSHSPAPWFFYNVMNKAFNQAAIEGGPGHESRKYLRPT